ncbi:MAG: formylmethanofuran dehydrogenase subunit B [Methanothrix sp.]|jgi:formylmethanofuran dehydrogenase subunit B|nr:formylmethanofuran dehydrogenase subunit B [Methanothrix sp.]OPY50267.1 MAG: Formate dehydrogenase subunit alpha [Methanosaeta sp. PtaU1.Bin055]NLX40244.1 formylmethanofuran dehydrogenase subunit B [Methanothrix sp.]HNR58187.1 formylmethanofuran dehydrogenase subunit B [Methanothrix sp.]HOI68987.1 formylmethanofuran dehydrogenase subunit B [Methanothrix sp.]
MIAEDVLCPFCGCLCDDIKVEVEEGKIVGVKRACRLGSSKILGHERTTAPMIRVDGELLETTYEEAYDQAAQILKEAKRPLLYGWCSTVCETAKLGILLAEEVGGVVDSTATVCHGPSIIGIEEKGMAGATLGQIKNRADLIVFWGANPAEAHPRHTVRYSSNARGMFTPDGRGGRKVIVVDVRETRTAKNADKFILIKPGTDYEVLSALRMIVQGKGEIVPETVAGVAKSDLEEAAAMMLAAKFGVVLIGLGLTHSRGRYKNVDNALSLVADLNGFTKFVVMAMRGHYNVAGFGQVCAWSTGFPMAVDLSRGAPYFNPGETAACDLLAKREADAMMVVAADPASNFPRATVGGMVEIPVIQIDPFPNPTTLLADVVIPTAVCGIEAEGTAYRMDGLSLRMKKVVDSPYPTDEEAVREILDRVRRLSDDN